MNQLLVAFGSHQVDIQTEDESVLDVLARSFRHLRGDANGKITVGTVKLVGSGAGFSGVGAGGARVDLSSLEAAVRWARYQAIERLIEERGDLIWFHGGAVGHGGRAVVLPGPRGRGKSTLVTGLWRRGCTFLTDDILPVDPRTDRIAPFPQLPAVRLDPGRELDEVALGAVPKDEIEIEERLERSALVPAAFVLPAFRRGAPARVVSCAIGEAALAMLEGCWNLARYGDAAAAYVARLGAQVPVCRVEFSEPDRALDLVMEWISTVG